MTTFQKRKETRFKFNQSPVVFYLRLPVPFPHRCWQLGPRWMMEHPQDSKLSEVVFEPASGKSKIQHLPIFNTGNGQLFCIAKSLVLDFNCYLSWGYRWIKKKFWWAKHLWIFQTLFSDPLLSTNHLQCKASKCTSAWSLHCCKRSITFNKSLGATDCLRTFGILAL